MASEFDSAQERVKRLKERPAPEELLELYALFKQATCGDVSGKRPGVLDFKGRAKFDAWQGKAGTPNDQCEQAYVDLVERLEGKYGLNG